MEFKFGDYSDAAEFIKAKVGNVCEIAVVLGSGLGHFAENLEDAVTLPYSDIPHFPVSTAPSHAGVFISGNSGGRRIIALSGRFHYYEGWSPAEAAFYVRALKLAGVKKLIITNAAGCINTSFNPGDLMLVTDHINFSGLSPCRGSNDERFGERFFDMSGAYSKRLLGIAQGCADKIGFPVRRGVYAFMTGPQYETPAEIRALKVLGADAVGMSTVFEVIEAAHCGLETLCISCLTNYAAGVTNGLLSENEVVDAARKAMPRFSEYLGSIIAQI